MGRVRLWDLHSMAANGAAPATKRGKRLNAISGANAPELPAASSNAQRGSELALQLSGARRGNRQSLGELLTHYRSYLTLLATAQIEKRLQPRVSPSDVVQEAMLKAHRHFGQFRGQTEKELLAWLRQVLLTSLARFVE